MAGTLTLYKNQHSVTLPYLEAANELRKAPFGVYLEFIDPRTNTLVQKLFPFFYQPLETYGVKGRCLITEYQGMPIYIPSDLQIYINQQQKQNTSMIIFNSSTGILSGGVFITKNIIVDVGVNFRLGCDFDISFGSLLSRSGHNHLCGNETTGSML